MSSMIYSWSTPSDATKLLLISYSVYVCSGHWFILASLELNPSTGAKHTVSDQWNSLKVDTIEILECLESRFRMGIYTEQDLHAIVVELELGGGDD